LLEAVLLGAAGACIGIVAGFAISSLLAFADFGAGFVGQMRLSWFVAKIALVFVTAMTLTTVGASIPAWIASKMPPMDAMRGEK
jgi:ABC-type antimicrobial peptide transport system permease subunit